MRGGGTDPESDRFRIGTATPPLCGFRGSGPATPAATRAAADDTVYSNEILGHRLGVFGRSARRPDSLTGTWAKMSELAGSGARGSLGYRDTLLGQKRIAIRFWAKSVCWPAAELVHVARCVAMNSQDAVWVRLRGLRTTLTAPLAPGHGCRSWRGRGRGGVWDRLFFAKKTAPHLAPRGPARKVRIPGVRPSPTSRDPSCDR